MEKTRFLAVDDSALIRNLLSRKVNAQPDMRAVGAVADPIVARDMIKSLNPDALTLDIQMPRMDGLAFLDQLMRLKPTPVLMISTSTEKGAEATMRALELGAVDFLAKPRPKLDVSNTMADYARGITDKIRAAARAGVRIARSIPAKPARFAPVASGARFGGTKRGRLTGDSTGGTGAIREVLPALPPDAPGILIGQHMPAGFTKSSAERLNKTCPLAVKEAEGGERVLPGHVYITPGSHDLPLKRNESNYVTALSDTVPVNRHKPSWRSCFSPVPNWRSLQSSASC